MVMKVDGVAVVEDYYVSDSGQVFKLRDEDILYAIEHNYVTTFVEDHIETVTNDVKGIVTNLNFDGGLSFTSILNDDYTEKRVAEIVNNGGIPNLSVKMRPSTDAAIAIVMDVDGNEYHTADKWELMHISLVDNGRCKPENGCGIYSYELLLSEKEHKNGDNMVEEQKEVTICDLNKKISALELQLSELDGTVKTLTEENQKLKEDKEAIELVLSETEENVREMEEQEREELRASILKLDAEYELSGKEDKESLELILGNLRRSNVVQKSNRGERNTETDDAQATILKLKQLTGRKTITRN